MHSFSKEFRLFIYLEKKKKVWGEETTWNIAPSQCEGWGLLADPFTDWVWLEKATKASVCRYATVLKQEHGLQRAVLCSPAGYLTPSCKSGNAWNQYSQGCPGFVLACNLRWDTELQNLKSCLPCLSHPDFCVISRSKFENWRPSFEKHLQSTAFAI